MNRKGQQEFLDKLVPLGSSLWRIRPGSTVCQLDQCDYGDGNLDVRDCAGCLGKHLPGIQPLTFGCD